jgi:hypothetical protein
VELKEIRGNSDSPGFFDFSPDFGLQRVEKTIRSLRPFCRLDLVSCPRNSMYFVAIKMGRRQGAPSRTGGRLVVFLRCSLGPYDSRWGRFARALKNSQLTPGKAATLVAGPKFDCQAALPLAYPELAQDSGGFRFRGRPVESLKRGKNLTHLQPI